MNDLSLKMRRDALRQSEGEVAQAEKRLSEVLAQIRALREREGMIDPAKTAAASADTAARVQEDLVRANTRLSTLRSYMRDTSPTVMVLKAQIRSLEAQRRRLVVGVADPTPAKGDAAASAVGSFEALDNQRKFAEDAYHHALEGLDRARAAADRQQVYIASFVPPSLAEEALYPRRWRALGIVALIAFAIWAIGSLTLQSIRDHLNRGDEYSEFEAMDTFAVDLLPVVSFAKPRPRLAIVSTTSRLCGIGAYTAALRKQLDQVFEVTVLELDQYLLRGRHPRLRRRADLHVREICARAQRFRRGEPATRARHAGQRDKGHLSPLLLARRRRTGIVGDLPHTARAGCGRRCGTSPSIGGTGCCRRESPRPCAARSSASRSPRSSITSATGATSTTSTGSRRSYDHPLSFMSGPQAAAVQARAARREFPMLAHIPSDARLIGAFGFLNGYKGLGTAIRALRHLPDDHHLLIFGGIHPNEIAAGKTMHPYLATLYGDAYADATPYGDIAAGGKADTAAIRLVVEADRGLAELIGPHPRDVSSRLHFMGAPDDDDFLCGMAICDVVLFPYLEVGQSSSGPISQAIELGCRVIASRTHTFLGFAEYHREAVEFFDIGNYLELAERIRAGRHFPARNQECLFIMSKPTAIFTSRPIPIRRTELRYGRPGLHGSGARGSRSVTTSTTTGSSAASASLKAPARSRRAPRRGCRGRRSSRATLVKSVGPKRTSSSPRPGRLPAIR